MQEASENTAPLPAQWPLVGREAELRFASNALSDHGAVVVAGVGGVGKTRILNTLAERAGVEGWSVTHAIGSRTAKSIPLAAVAHLVPADHLEMPRAAVLAATVTAFTADGPDRRRLLCVDDAHLLDDASATLVQMLARQHNVGVAITLRSGEPCPDAVSGLWKDGVAPRLELQPLSEREVASLIALALGGPLDRATVRLLYATTRGNTLYLRELIAEGIVRGSLSDENGTWRWTGSPVVSPTLRDLIDVRFERLGPEEQDALELISVGEPLSLRVVEHLVDPGVLDRLEAGDFIEVMHVGARREVRTGHPLYGEARRAALPQRRADQLRRRVVEAMEDHDRHIDPLHIAALRVDAGMPTDPPLLVAAARRAWALTDTDLVEGLVVAALALGPNIEASYLLGEVMADRNRYDEAVALWQSLLESDCPDDLRARIAMAAASVLALTRNRPDDAKAVLGDAERAVTSADARQRLVSARNALFVHHLSVDELQEAVDPLGAATEVSDEARVWAWIASARLRMTAGQQESVITESDRIDAFAERARIDWPLSALLVSICRFFALLLASRLDDAESLASDGLEQALIDPSPYPRAHWTQGLGLVALARGHLGDAAAHHEGAVALLRANDNGTLRPTLFELAFIRALRGEAAGAEQALREAEAANQGVLEPFVDPARARAAILAAAGSVSSAREVMHSHAEWARSVGQPIFELPALHDLTRYGGAAEAVQRLAALCLTCEGPMPSLFAEQAAALAAGDGVALVDLAQRYAALGCELDAAECETAAIAALRTDGRSTEATAAARRAAALAERCGQPHTPLLADVEGTASLSKREIEVAALAVGGMSDAQIADRLYLSVRTVNAHLRSIYTKLGVAGRSGLAEALGRETI